MTNFKEICSTTDQQLRINYAENAKKIIAIIQEKHNALDLISKDISNYEDFMKSLEELDLPELDYVEIEENPYVTLNGEQVEFYPWANTDTGSKYYLFDGKLLNSHQVVDCRIMYSGNFNIAKLLSFTGSTEEVKEKVEEINKHPFLVDVVDQNAFIQEINKYGFAIQTYEEHNFTNEELQDIYSEKNNESWDKETCLHQAQTMMGISLEEAESYCS